MVKTTTEMKVLIMVSQTFENLPDIKKERILTALLHEFTVHPFKEAKVAPIVKEAQIARGAFYKYFTDLDDAYAYVYQQALLEIHTPFTKEMTLLEMGQATREFITKATTSPYFEFLRLHLTVNEKPLAVKEKKPLRPTKAWAAMTLCHQTIREALADPVYQEDYLLRLEQSLALLSERKSI